MEFVSRFLIFTTYGFAIDGLQRYHSYPQGELVVCAINV